MKYKNLTTKQVLNVTRQPLHKVTDPVAYQDTSKTWRITRIIEIFIPEKETEPIQYRLDGSGANWQNEQHLFLPIYSK